MRNGKYLIPADILETWTEAREKKETEIQIENCTKNDTLEVKEKINTKESFLSANTPASKIAIPKNSDKNNKFAIIEFIRH